jgi:hypothetical protein
MEEVQAIVERIDFSWEQGFLDKEDYLEKRRQLQQELNALRPVDYDELVEAADLLENFTTYWNACAEVDKPDEARYQLVSKIVDRVFVYNDQILGVVLHGDFAVVLGENTTAPEENSDAAEWETISQSLAKFLRSQCGSDGHGSLTGCVVWVPNNAIYHLLLRQIVTLRAA